MSDNAPLTYDTFTSLHAFTGPLDRGPDNSLYASTVTGWHHIPLADLPWTGHHGAEDVFHALRLMTRASGQLSLDGDGSQVTGIRAVARYSCDRTVTPPMRTVEATDSHGTLFLMRRDGDEPPTSYAPIASGSRGSTPAALAELTHTWATCSGPPTDHRTAFDNIARHAEASLPADMSPEARRWCLGAAGYLLSRHIGDQIRRRDHTEADERITAWAQEVSDRLGTAIEDEQISLEHAQTIGIDLQLPPLSLLYTVRLLIPVNVDVRAHCEDAATDAARDRIAELLEHEHDTEFDIDAATVEHVHGPQ